MSDWEAYRRFVQTAPVGSDGYLFDVPRCRFEPEAGDELVAPPGVVVNGTGTTALVELPSGARLLLQGIEVAKLRAAFAALPCSYSRLVLVLGPDLPSFMQQAFSRVLFAPKAVAELEMALPAVEIVRFAGSPYEIVRSYWRNSAAVHRRIAAAGTPGSVAELRALLLELHELLLLGEDVGGRSSFYLPASSLGRKRPQPGSFYETPSTFERRGDERILTGGARVSVPLLGGDNYWQLLAESVDDPAALASERSVVLDGEPQGVVLQARSEDEALTRPWFLPPRPFSERHFEALLAALRAGTETSNAAHALAALAEFHYRFVRLHPLPSGNQSLSMAFVNARLRSLLGAGMPHLLLDQLALRFDLTPYQRLFTRAARAWCLPWPSASERTRQLMRMTYSMNELVSSLGNAASLIEARGLLAATADRVEEARLSLLTDMAPAGDEALRIG